jgi:hypothetical protein
MASTGVARRPGRPTLVVLLLAALLGVLGQPAFLPARDIPLSKDSGDTVGVTRVDAMSPSRAIGRPVAGPSLVCVAELPAGTVPCGAPPVALVRLDDLPAGPITTRHLALGGAAGMRAPPNGQVDL